MVAETRGIAVPTKDVKLLVRADDLGSNWACNIGCVQACTDGIARSVEVMMPCAWVTHASRLLARHSHIDVGIHLTLTSEWDAVKWRPLTPAPSLIDEHGFFRPLLVPRAGDDRPNQRDSGWSIDDVAAEFRAQIVSGLALFPGASHISSHMTRHFGDFDPSLGSLIADLCGEFGLKNDPMGGSVPRFEGYPKFPRAAAARETSFIAQLGALESGTYIFVDHPAPDTPEMRAAGHRGYEDVAEDRAACLSGLTSHKVKAAIDDLGIELIDYRSL